LALACVYIADTLVEELDELDELDDPDDPPELLDPPPELAAKPAAWGSATPSASANAQVTSTRLVACILFLLRKSPGTGLQIFWVNEQAIGCDYSSPLLCASQSRYAYYRR
jgi:hypothetical protein